MSRPLTPTTVARRLGVSSQRVRQLDVELAPRRGDLGVRLYDAENVDRLAAIRRTRAELGRRRIKTPTETP
jgi:DNA-binding transcriptional MerR regulator